MEEAKYYHLEKGKIRCNLCPHNCLIAEGKKGICRVRKNIEGKLVTENYAKISSIGFDPIEKKPLYHFFPGEEILSVGTFGCNFHCGFCQNWQISQDNPPTREIYPRELVQLAQKKGSMGLAYTYSEPGIWFEYVLETAQIAHKEGLKNVIVSNGYLQQEPLKELLPYLDGANIDLKAISDSFYKEVCGGRLEPVQKTINILFKDGIHIELTTLLIPGFNDSEEDLIDLFGWVKDISKDIPLHLSRYFPGYKMEIPPTPVVRMEKAYQLARKFLNYVYLGNMVKRKESSTYCPQCGEEVITRKGYLIHDRLNKGECPVCGFSIYGRFKT